MEQVSSRLCLKVNRKSYKSYTAKLKYQGKKKSYHKDDTTSVYFALN